MGRESRGPEPGPRCGRSAAEAPAGEPSELGLRGRVEAIRRGLAALPESLPAKWRAFSEGLGEYYYGPYRQALARAERDEDDLFMLYVCGEALGIPNPASAYTMELYPIVLEEFHAWHTRMGMDRPPTDGIRCC